MPTLTLSSAVLRVPFTQVRSNASVNSASSSSSHTQHDTVYLHPSWMEKNDLMCDDAVLLCHALPSSFAQGPARFQSCLARVQPLDPSVHASSCWSSIDLSSALRPTISFQMSIDGSNWQSRQELLFRDLPDAERAEREQRSKEGDMIVAPRPPPTPAPSATAAAAGGLKTPVKSKLVLLPPSASSAAKASAAPAISAQLALAAAAKLQAMVEPSVALPNAPNLSLSADSSSLDANASSFYILSLRSSKLASSSATAATSGPVPKATRILLRPFSPSSASSNKEDKDKPKFSKEEEMELASALKNTFQRSYICSNVIIDTRSIGLTKFRTDFPFLQVCEISPENEISQIARTTHIVLDLSNNTSITSTVPHSTPSPLSPTALSSPSSSSASTTVAEAAKKQIHPALAALHSLLLPPLLYPQAFQHLNIDTPKGLLLSGPPGVGKTYSVARVCKELGVSLFVMDGASVYSGGEGVAGEAEETMRNMFRQAQACQNAAVLFIDEIDVLCPHRTNEATQLSNRLVAQLLSLMDGLENRGHLLIVGATNHPNALDAALRRPGRFDRELRLEPPSIDQRLSILQHYTIDIPLDADVDLPQLATGLIGYVGADLAALVREASLHALQRFQQQQKQSQQSSESSSTITTKPTVSSADFTAARLLVPASSLRGNGSLVSKPTTSWSEIGGLAEVKRTLRQAIEWPMLHADAFNRFGLAAPRGILLYGPPGCSKTTLVRAVAASSHSAFLPLDTAQLFSCYVGEAERILRSLFQRARANRPCCVFIDEIDAMVHKRSMGGSGGGGGSSSGGEDAHSLEARILSTLLNEMDGMVSSSGVLVIAATNRLDMLDEALLRPGRFDQIIHVPPPDAQSRFEILHLHARKMLHEPESSATVAELHQLANELEGYTGADLTNLCREAAMSVLRQNIHQQKVTVADLRTAAAHSTPSLTAELIRHYASTGR